MLPKSSQRAGGDLWPQEGHSQHPRSWGQQRKAAGTGQHQLRTVHCVEAGWMELAQGSAIAWHTHPIQQAGALLAAPGMGRAAGALVMVL